jgi:multidrug efflux pump subunit AcrA (membrane-fusion protein)
LSGEGDQVQAGQVILVLDNTQLSAQLDASKAQARFDRVNAERYQYLFEQGAASAKRRDSYATKAIESRDQAIADKANLNYKFVRSPINGVIGDLDTVKIGDYVKTGDIITGIVDNSTLWTLMEIPASQASQVKVGQLVQLASQSAPQVTGEGKNHICIALLRHSQSWQPTQHADGEGGVSQPHRAIKNRPIRYLRNHYRIARATSRTR